ncbi:class I SAM-dependent methyltransferase [Methanobrevibacter sp. TMH8]|uniref:class I SAM-dependent methyltransferase n=1 Tax=Methanobrevibacter sp. TMH8 TaxID=2848611 RepID=UPI001CCD4C53|nr:class I SAM-dependent methyltransferase [Methanobrevibacter sp. TMH8]MBZ9570453.1 class I SAM-dependent methyltransferase [Methanobrevibacter sp. TMH8]
MIFKKGYYEKEGYNIFINQKNYRKSYNSLTNHSQISFLLGLISSFKFSNGESIKTALEVGIYNGVTSTYMLKEGSKKNNFSLYCIEKGEEDFFGEVLLKECSSDELKNCSINKGCTVFDIENILKEDTKLDLVFLDAGHSHPYPLIDLIHVIPYLHDESIVLLHDVVDYMRPNAWGESFIYTDWSEYKYRTCYIDSNQEIKSETSLGYIEIPKNKEIIYENLLKIAKIPFRASPWKIDDIYLGISKESIGKLKIFMEKYYDKKFVEEIIGIFYKNLEEYTDHWNLYHHETKFFNYLYENSQNHAERIGKLEKRNQKIEQDLKRKNKLLKEIQNSNSWKITKPLRKIGKKLK